MATSIDLAYNNYPIPAYLAFMLLVLKSVYPKKAGAAGKEGSCPLTSIVGERAVSNLGSGLNM